MNDRDRPDSILERVRRWWKSGDTDEQYLAASSDLADFERRQRTLERSSRGPSIVTFNH